jgi:hypothetical protein
LAAFAGAIWLLGTGVASAHLTGAAPERDPFAVAAAAEFEGPVARAECGPGSSPETALQGQVPRGERESGRSGRGYSCNLERIGWYQGEGASWVSQSYGHCAYVATRFPSEARSPGVQVLDVSDPANPRRTATLTTPAMRGPWETLKVSPRRGLLAAVSASAPLGQGAAFFDVYDIGGDCAHPRLLNSVSESDLSAPANSLGHEGGFSPDGMTYWSTFAYQGTITAIDVANPAVPRILYTGRTGTGNHGFGFSADGRRLYLAHAGRADNILLTSNGLQVFDVSEVQDRRPAPQIREVGRLFWEDGAIGQHAIPISYGGRPHVVFVDEMLAGAARIIDVSDEAAPRTISKLRLEIQMPGREDIRRGDTTRPNSFGYDGHYCEADRAADPALLACGYFASGIRVFDVRDPRAPREIAYYNPPAQTGSRERLPGSEHAATDGDLTTDWCSSPPRFVGDQLWVTCQDNGFMVLRFTAAPPAPRPAVGSAPALGLPSAARCVARTFVFRLRRGLRSVRVYVNGRRVRVPRSRRVRVRVEGTARVRVVARTRRGRRVRDERAYRAC